MECNVSFNFKSLFLFQTLELIAFSFFIVISIWSDCIKQKPRLLEILKKIEVFFWTKAHCLYMLCVCVMKS